MLMAGAGVALVTLSGLGQPQPGGGPLVAEGVSTTPAEQALALALAGPDGEYAAYAEYTAIVQKFGEVQPYAAIRLSEQRHIEALQRHLQMRGLTVPENPYLGKTQAPATLNEAAQTGIAAEERNVAMYAQLLEQIGDQPDLARVFTHLQWASREHHLPAFQAAAANGGQLGLGEFGCGMRRGRGGSGPPPWAGPRGRGLRSGGCCGTCPLTPSVSGTPANRSGGGYRQGAVEQPRAE